MEKKAEWMEGRGRKLWKTNDHNPIGYNDGLGVIKALSLSRSRRRRLRSCDTLMLSCKDIGSYSIFLLFFLLLSCATTSYYFLCYPHTHTPYLLSLSPCRSMTCCTEGEIPKPPTPKIRRKRERIPRPEPRYFIYFSLAVES